MTVGTAVFYPAVCISDAMNKVLGSPLSSKLLWFVDAVLSLTINETLEWLSQPILMQESFWWWQCSDRYIISLFTPPLHTPYPPLLPAPNKPCSFYGC